MSKLNQLNRNQGFTLIELLVAIVIIGALGAVALPSYLNQAAKARGSEAKSHLGSIKTAQAAYRLETNTFATSLSNLDVRVSGKFYSYSMEGSSTSLYAEHRAVPLAGNNDLRSYASAVAQPSETELKSIICQSDNTFGDGGTVNVVDTTLICDTGSSKVD
jgi:type IV pilus assembly protein PilA